MLYVTTRNKVESFTAYHVLSHDRSSDGGCFVPMHLPVISPDELSSLVEQSFGQCIASILNLFFSARLDGWDVDFCIGRYPVRLVPLNRKIYIAEQWHNPDRDFARIVRNLSSRIHGRQEITAPTQWAWMAVRISVLFGVYSQMRKQGILEAGQELDISVDASDFSLPMVCWYARKMGLPIGNVICVSLNSSRFWDFLRSGVFQTATSMDTDHIHYDLERLIYSVFGHDEVQRYLNCCQQGRSYSLNELRLTELCHGFRACVVSSRRVADMIRSTYGNAAYLLDSSVALAFAGLQDVRAAVGESRVTLLMSERSAVGIPMDELRNNR